MKYNPSLCSHSIMEQLKENQEMETNNEEPVPESHRHL